MHSIFNGRSQLSRERLRWLAAPEGWCAFVLDAELPLRDDLAMAYANAANYLLRRIPYFAPPYQQELALQFFAMHPQRDIPVFQQNARTWMPSFGLGHWPHRGAPTLWTKEEFLEAESGELRPFMYRLIKIKPDVHVIESAWSLMLGRGVCLRIATKNGTNFYQEAKRIALETITDRSLTSFPFYVPLLEFPGVHRIAREALEQQMCGADAYLRESTEDAGLLFVFRANAEEWFEALHEEAEFAGFTWEIERLS